MHKYIALIVMITSYFLGIATGILLFSNHDSEYECNIIVSEVSSSDTDILIESIGENVILLEGTALIKYKLPEDFHPHMNHSRFQPYMDYRAVKNKKSGAYKILNHQNAYSDDEGFRRLRVDENDFSISEEDDYLIALGNYYKKKGSVGDRFLIITTTGMYTAVVGDEKSNSHTDKRNMFTVHGKNRQYAGAIEWIVDSKKICKNIKRAGSITASNNPLFQGDILHIYKII